MRGTPRAHLRGMDVRTLTPQEPPDASPSPGARALERAQIRSYNHFVATTILEEMKSYVGFGPHDAAALAALRPIVDPHLPAVVDRFYAEILRHPGARTVLAGGEAQVGRLRGHLLQWLRTLFGGAYDEGYAQQRAAIGQVHVRVGLPQHYMFVSLEVIREELEGVVRRSGLRDAEEKLRSLSKLLALETGLMLESYRASYVERVRQAAHEAMQERIHQAERLAEIGQLAASLAHEIKNPLAGISGAIQVIREEMSAGDPHREVLTAVLRQIDRLDGTVKDLLTYARPQTPRFKLCRLGGVVERVVGLLRQEPAFESLTLECEDGAELPMIEADEHQIEQVLVNLLLNAAHASEPGAAVQLRIAVDGQEAAIVVQDHGEGMDEETRRRALEPFFTTKARGTGLGLPICTRIVDAHGGTLRLHSEPGRGTAVEVRLPLRRSMSGDGSGVRA